MHSHDANGLPNPLEVCQHLVGFLKNRLSCLQTHLIDGRHLKITPWAASRSDRAERREGSLHVADSSDHQTANLIADQGTTLPGQHPISTVTKEDLGRATWLLLHTIAAQFPARPSKQQRKDVAALVRLTCILDSSAVSNGGCLVTEYTLCRWTH
jgi:FAD-linked sulfhydryl oxidase